MGTYKIHISGIVQGVGFRPLVYNLAKKLGIPGTVSNNNQGVIIHCSACSTCVDTFVDLIHEKQPEQAVITKTVVTQIKDSSYVDFKIISSKNSSSGQLLVTPDYAICPECNLELTDSGNRRFEYPFITCTNCGPRYSIINNLPYDRHLTTMHSFTQCKRCNDEYNDPTDRRFYSQTNSCPDCGISLQLFDTKNTSKPIHEGQEIKETVKTLQQGKIVAVKGIGGYLIMGDAKNAAVVQQLRQKKLRPSKPFALMVDHEERLTSFCSPTKSELKEWNSSVAPIVLFPINEITNLPTHIIAPGLKEIGVMKAYTPLHVLLCKSFQGPLIATSANLTDSPIIYSDKNALQNLNAITDFVLTNNRDIVVPQDDSVLRFTENGQKIVIRRSRGLAPNYFSSGTTIKSNILAVGAMLKSAFAITQNENVFISQYLGATNSYETQQAFTKVYEHLKNTLQFTPEVIITDQHPGYFTTEWAEDLAFTTKIPLHSVQHHEAHFCAVLGENDLWNTTVLGFIWDGTGLGNDQQIWGGETMTYENGTILRNTHLPYHKHILGDKMVTEPRISALSFFGVFPEAQSILKEKFNTNEWKAFQNQITSSQLQTSSMGRLFDAVSSILNICNKTTFHGESAMLLEAMATSCSNPKKAKAYPVVLKNGQPQIDSMLQGILHDFKSGSKIEFIALKFHLTLVEIIALTAKASSIQTLAFSGGVFQNKLLVDLLIQKLGSTYQLNFHKQLSPNDECIAYGQLMHYQYTDKSHNF